MMVSDECKKKFSNKYSKIYTAQEEKKKGLNIHFRKENFQTVKVTNFI